MKRYLLCLSLISLPAVSAENCVMQDRVVSRSEATIQERSPIRRDVVPYMNNQRKCIVDFRVRINREWHTAFGEHVWSGDAPVDQACARAVAQAENQVLERVGTAHTMNERILVCKDEPRLTTLATTKLGSVGDIGQFRPHPRYPNRFYHNGTQCRWFVEPNFVNNDIRNFQGVICEIGRDQWVVVDKF